MHRDGDLGWVRRRDESWREFQLSERLGQFNQQQYGEAESTFKEAVEMDAESSNAWNGLGWARFHQGKHDEAIEAFERCLEIEPNQAGAQNGLGQLYLSRGDFECAEKYLLNAAPTAAAWFGLARLYLLQENFTEALVWITKIESQQGLTPVMKQMKDAAEKKELPADLRAMLAPTASGPR